jgi:hypothetical protein
MVVYKVRKSLVSPSQVASRKFLFSNQGLPHSHESSGVGGVLANASRMSKLTCEEGLFPNFNCRDRFLLWEAHASLEDNRGTPSGCCFFFGPGLKVEDWYVRSGGKRHLLSMIRSR